MSNLIDQSELIQLYGIETKSFLYQTTSDHRGLRLTLGCPQNTKNHEEQRKADVTPSALLLPYWSTPLVPN
jgi:hypothetical protein